MNHLNPKCLKSLSYRLYLKNLSYLKYLMSHLNLRFQK